MSLFSTQIRLSWLMLWVLLLTACPPEKKPDQNPDPVRTFIVALPTSTQMKVDVPGVQLDDFGNLSFADGLATVPIEEHNSLRKLVLHAVKDADRGLNLLLDPLREITEAVQEPEIVQESPIRAVWRYTRSTGDLEMTLVLEENDDKSLSFILVDREIGAANEGWQVRIFGTYTPWATPPDGNGAAWVNLRGQGKVLIIWTRDGGNREFTIHHHSVTKEALQPDGLEAVEPQEVTETLTFSYTGTESGEGSFLFGPKFLDVYQPSDETKPPGPVPAPQDASEPDEQDESQPIDSQSIDTVALDTDEKLNVMVRWNSNGAGRIDATARGPNIKNSNFKLGRLEECWESQSFERSYLYYALYGKNDATQEVFAKDGDPGACPYSESLDILLPILGDVPLDPPIPQEVVEDLL
jgi:hypothetical protein